MLEKMSDFFENRLDGYDEHMMTNIESASEFYPYTADCLPKIYNCNILDLGCGTGMLGIAAALVGCDYVTMYDTPIPIDIKNKSVVECKIIQGLAHDFSINGSTNITIDNLDADYRLYFTESMIAQNGIFINSSQDSTYWRAVDNLESTQLGQKVFKFGVMPVTNTCYIEFPQDAATLFGNGINIKLGE